MRTTSGIGIGIEHERGSMILPSCNVSYEECVTWKVGCVEEV